MSAPDRRYRARFVMSVVMGACVGAVLLIDPYLPPAFPCLIFSLMALAIVSAGELHTLAENLPRPPKALCMLVVALVIASGWPAHLGWTGSPIRPWRDIQSTFTVVVLLGFFWEMAFFRRPDGAVSRLAFLFFIAIYVGLVPCFLVQLRWLPGEAWRGSAAIAMTIFVPKCGDIGAYLVGKTVGRTPMTPVLSPNKTWEGFVGGLLGSVLTAISMNHYLPLLSSQLFAALFGLSVGLAGVLGDLAESLVKRDMGRKDASGSVPGFGGILDVADSVIFAAPVAFWWLMPWAGVD